MNEKQLFKKIYDTSKKTSLEVYVVGGYVRDEILKEQFPDEYPRKRLIEEKSKVRAAIEKDILEGGEDIIVEKIKEKNDIDFVVLGSGIEFTKVFDKIMKEEGTLVEFENFDTARYVFEDCEIEFAGARKEEYKKGSRKPEVESATLEEDLSRRDFTVNAMARKVIVSGLSKAIVDPYGGQEDLKAKLLRTPLEPNETFSEDPLRMLRSARFSSQLGFKIEEKTYKALFNNRKRLKIVSKERILDEFLKILETAQPSVGLSALFKTKVMHEFLPEVVELDGVEEIYGRQHKNNLWHTFKVIDNLATRTGKIMLRYAALMHDIGKPGTKVYEKKRGWTFDMHEHLGFKIVRQIGKRLRMSTHDIKYVARLVRWHQQPIQLMDSKITDSAVRRLLFNLGDDIDDLLKLCRSDITTGNPKKLTKRLKNYDILEDRLIKIIEKDKLRGFHSPVRGEEIMEETNLKAGPTVGKIKKAIEEAILEGEIKNDYDEALEYFLRIKDEFCKGAEKWERKK